MSYAKSKNLTVYDVLTIASMIEGEAGVAEASGQLVAAVIYNRLHDGMPLGIDATIRFATGNYDEPADRIRTGDRLALQHPHQRRACRRGRSTAPAWPRSRPRRTRPRPTTSST